MCSTAIGGFGPLKPALARVGWGYAAHGLYLRDYVGPFFHALSFHMTVWLVWLSTSLVSSGPCYVLQVCKVLDTQGAIER